MRCEVWELQDGECRIVTVFPTTTNAKFREVFMQVDEPTDVPPLKLREIEGDDWNDVMRQHHELMGWEPYKPIDD